MVGPVRGTFLVIDSDGESGVLQDVTTSQIHPLGTAPPVPVGSAFQGTIAPDPPLEVVWTIESLTDHWEITVSLLDEPLTDSARAVGAQTESGTVGIDHSPTDGERHIIPTTDPEGAAADLRDDRQPRRQAAKLGADRVEIRVGEDLVSLYYRQRSANSR